MNYDEYNWPFNPDSVNVDETTPNPNDQPQDPSENPASNSYIFGCVGQDCCSDGTKFDETTKKCVEGFENARFTQNSFSKNNSEIKLFKNSNNIKPYQTGVNFASVN